MRKNLGVRKTKRNTELWLDIIGLLLIGLFVVRLFSLLRGESLINVFWLCNHVPLILGIAILFRSSFWLTAEISILFIASFTWVMDYLSTVFFGFHITGATSYLFPVHDFVFFFITGNVHFLSIPLAILALVLMRKPEPKAWIGSLIHAIVLLPIIIYFGEAHNLNCFFKSCISIIPQFYLYPLFAFIFYFMLFVIPINYLLTRLIKNIQ